MHYILALGNLGEKLNEKKSVSDYVEFTYQLRPLLGEIAGRC